MDIREEVPIKSFSICAFIVDTSGEIPLYLILRRKTGQYLGDSWQMVSGRIEQDETAWQAALREIKEETGVMPDRFYSANKVEMFYEDSQNCINLVPVFVAILDRPQEITITEHSEFKWIRSNEVGEYLVFENQRESIMHIERNFVLREPNPFLLINI